MNEDYPLNRWLTLILGGLDTKNVVCVDYRIANTIYIESITYVMRLLAALIGAEVIGCVLILKQANM